MNRRPAAILTNATIIATLDQAAIAYADDYLAGWPTTTPGASPAEQGPVIECPRQDCNQNRPCPDHDGGLTRDKVATELEQYLDDLRVLTFRAERAARFATFYGLPGLNEASVKQRLVSIDQMIWCNHCVQFGRHEPKAKDQTECEFCASFRVRYKKPPPKLVWDARDARNGRIDETTITRLLRQAEADRKANAAAARARQRAEGKVS